MSEQSGSHTVESQETQEDDRQQAVQDAFAAFGLDTPSGEENAPEGQQEMRDGDKEEAPAIEQKPEPKVIKVKHNKQEIEVDVSDDKLPEYVQKALALDKERERKSEYEKALDRAAKLAGFKDHADFIANLDRIEQAAQQRQQDEFQQLRQQLRQEAEDAGLDPEKVEAWIQNHPDYKEAQRIKAENAERANREAQERMMQEQASKWEALYSAYPELRESATVFFDGGSPDWYTPEMQARIERGYDPVDAYELAHKTAILERNKQQGRLQAIKEQRLGLRAQVETEANGDLEPEVPAPLASAFKLFGLDERAAKKYVKK